MAILTCPPPPMIDRPIQRLRLTVRGAVQGVGFRPFIYRFATALNLQGWVKNSSQGVIIEVEGPEAALREFVLRIDQEKPPRASIQSLESSWLDPVGHTAFTIRESEDAGAKTAPVLPDIALCADCLRDILDPGNRRYRYPFTNCTNCGPRYSILLALPYDRPNTTLREFVMCEKCRAEYEDPRDRRFHAQPNACATCGPRLDLWDSAGKVLSTGSDALSGASEAIRQGKIVAVKGLGGFHLVVDARHPEIVARLRARKHREEKPLALMVPSLEEARCLCLVSPTEERLLRSPEAPIVLLHRRTRGSLDGNRSAIDAIADPVAPGNPYLGLMLPYTPLHALLLGELGFPVVATSGNLSDEPICTDEHEALERLRGVADLFLVHNRPIARHVDDSVARVVLDRELVLRRARGYAPLPIGSVDDADSASPPVLAVGGHLKNSVAISVGGRMVGSQHIGDLETSQAFEAFERAIGGLESLYEVEPARIVCDAHPDYLSTQYARRSGLPVLAVQHHVAHLLSCMADNELEEPVCGISWDGAGYGLDGTVWGGEFFHIGKASLQRVAHLRAFRLPGGERAIKEPRRSAIALLYEMHGEIRFEWRDLPPLRCLSARQAQVLQTLLERRVNAPFTSSAGRLFDGVASLVGLRQIVGFEGQAAMDLEFATHGTDTAEAYPFRVLEDGKKPAIVDWEPMLAHLLDDIRSGDPVPVLAGRFHNTLAEIIVEIARRTGDERVVLSGGCFQNACLTEQTVTRLRREGFRPYWHQRVPPNDGGLAFGQLMAARRAEGSPPACA